MKKRIVIAFIVCLLGALVLGGCARNTATPSPSPMVTPGTTPMSSVAPMVSPSPAESPSTSPMTTPDASSSPNAGADDAKANLESAKRIEGEIDKMSEIKGSTVLVNAGQAIVAVEFDDTYRGELTERITDMISEKAKEVDSQITEVLVTDDAAMREEIKDMRAGMDDGGVLENIKAEFEKLIQRIKPAV